MVDTLETGAFVRWRPVVARNREYVTLHCSLRLVDIVRPMKVKQVPVAGGVKARIQVPEMHELEKRLSVTLPLGGCAAFVVGAGPAAQAKHTTIAFVRATIGSPAGVRRRDLQSREVGPEEPAEAAELGEDAGGESRTHLLLDPRQRLVLGVDIDASGAVGGLGQGAASFCCPKSSA